MRASDERIARALDPKAKRVNGSWSCRCPAHEDKHASLSLSEKDGRLLWRCHAGCSQEDVRAELQKRGLLGKSDNADPTGKPRTPDQSDDWRPIAPVPDGIAEPGFTHTDHGKPSRIWTYRDAAGRVLFHVARFDQAGGGKQIIPRSWGTLKGRTGWYWRHPATPRPLYGLDRIAARPADPVLVVEGEKAADAAVEILPGYVPTTWPGGSNATGMADWSPLKGRCVMIWPDHDAPGRKAAERIGDALLPIAAEVRIVDPPAKLPAGWDLADAAPDWLDIRALIDRAERHVDRLDRLVADAATDPGAPFESEAIDFLAALQQRDQAAYERARARLKKAGVRISRLDQAVESRKTEAADFGDAPGKGKALELPEPEPWGEPVDGAELLGDLVRQIQRHVILSDPAALGAALWVLHTHAHDAAFHSPRLTLTSPTMRCGKSTLLRTIGRLVPRPLPTANITPAAMFRVIEAAKPTLLIDEADAFAQDNDELRGVINSSHCCLDAYVVRAVPTGDDYEARRFSTWSPMAIASIGKVASTIADRSILIGMERKPPNRTVARMRADRDDGFGVLARKAARWIGDHLEALRQADPDVPTALNDRQADNWRPLLAIADEAGAEWPAKARAAALALSAADDDADTIGVQLLADIQAVFGTTKAESIWTENLLKALHAMEERPWCEYGRRRLPISARQLAALLKPFGITSGTVRIGDDTAKGYRRDQFAEGWSRYVTTSQPKESATFGDFPSVTPESDVTDRKWQNPRETAACDAVTDREGGNDRADDMDIICCAYCLDPIDLDQGYSVISGGGYLHNTCVDAWVQQ